MSIIYNAIKWKCIKRMRFCAYAMIKFQLNFHTSPPKLMGKKRVENSAESELRIERQCKKKCFYRSILSCAYRPRVAAAAAVDVRVRMCIVCAFLHISLHVCIWALVVNRAAATTAAAAIAVAAAQHTYYHSYTTTIGLPVRPMYERSRNPYE